ncbi:hypothetical protein ADH76_11510 [Enterocloster clostridioformis]|nr:hypothetical protein [Enterocloster clostridioformis]ANU48262.1 hypothetical protein A4V08_23100 [Lachnoclostridium sp. YL32]NDO32795.1 hypothetical protein [Enterocloster clostridioformis]OXE69030.1 hypothetical protein ADH76_11510 [Enterocloster clostridioformis]QQR02852.1 hypothetical protein I5Q83_11715 [Enterocloster clostridioformis]
MEKITIDYSGYTPFKGARILYSYLEEGLECVKSKKIKDVCIWQGLENSRHIVNFDFLRDMEFIETFHWIVKLSKKSNINGLYSLSNLKDFRWVADNEFSLDFSKLNTIESMNLKYHDGLLNFKELINLRELYIGSVKSNNLEFLPSFDNLELLRIINGKFISLEGLERCKNLKKLDLRRCFDLVYANSTLLKLKHLESVALDSKKHDINVEELKNRIPHVWLG